MIHDLPNVISVYYVILRHITYRYIDPSRYNLENYLLPGFFPQSYMGWALAARPSQVALRGEIMEEKIFKIKAQQMIQLNIFV